ncbi:DUF1178 family protein [Hyphobacterium sp.]|jgi:hypothetical protein|uniref:DUF1178 family protein n=1 Tax=Hyphobacterium sp. TaxID=2004662 RepID=UPI003BA94513
MIRYALICDGSHEFEAWFRNSDDFDVQSGQGLVECPICGSQDVRKGVMAPAVATGKSSKSQDPQKAMMEFAGKVRQHISKNFDYVGDRFAREARAIHEGEKPERAIYGETTPAESKALAEEGVPCAPLPDPFVPPQAKKLN